jgi:uncharacterized protein (TIGR02452 family)
MDISKDTSTDNQTRRKSNWRRKPNVNRIKRREISLETVRIIEEDRGIYTLPNGETVKIPHQLLAYAQDKNAIRYYKDATKFKVSIQDAPHQPKIDVIDNDGLDQGLKLQDQGYNPLVLIMASRTHPGGGYLKGAGAQEENFFRRTNLFKYLEPYKKKYYPIPDYGGIYIDKAVVFRDTQAKDYQFLDQPRIMSFVVSLFFHIWKRR